MGKMLSTREVAKFLNVNEKMVYSLIAEKGLPASKVTGKWLFPKELVYQWIETGTQNFPQLAKLPPYHGLVLIAGSNDLLLDKIIATFKLMIATGQRTTEVTRLNLNDINETDRVEMKKVEKVRGQE